jgi:hypothetical protein
MVSTVSVERSTRTCAPLPFAADDPVEQAASGTASITEAKPRRLNLWLNKRRVAAFAAERMVMV